MGYKESYDQWKEFFIADFKPNLAENVVEEPLENPITHKTEFVKFNLMHAFEIGYISEYLADRVRTAVMKASLTGESPASLLHDLVIQEINLGDRTVMGMVFGKSMPANAAPEKAPDTWWAEEGMS
ncbi:MAG: hypothetical protein K5668_09055 [Lachnospiraceae bacterium]|nr:hypothetical protein [Lachnospiraceae bacterium]